MRVDRSHTPWLIFVLLATAVSGVLYAANYHPHDLPFPIKLPAFFGEVPPTIRSIGGTPLGLANGIVAYLIFLFAAALGIRKKRRLWPIGHVQMWIRSHIWLTTLTLPLVLFHCGFRAGGFLTSGILLLYGFVMISGFLGVALQQFMPRLMKDRLPREVVFEEIPYLRGQLFERAIGFRKQLREIERNPNLAVVSVAPTVLEADDPSVRVLGEFFDKHGLPYLAARRGDRLPLGNIRRAAGLFREVRMDVSTDWQDPVDDLESWCDERRVMDLQTKYQHWLHAWLLIHVPASFALLIFTAWHAWAGLHFSAASL